MAVSRFAGLGLDAWPGRPHPVNTGPGAPVSGRLVHGAEIGPRTVRSAFGQRVMETLTPGVLATG